MIGVASRSGGFFALCIASFAMSTWFNWRMAFWFGGVIAVVGLVARRRLRETTEFVDYKRRIANKMEHNHQDPKTIKNVNIVNEKINKKTVLAFFFTEFHIPLCLYVTYIYLGSFMKKSFGMTPEQVIHQNLKVTIFTVICTLFIAYLVKRFHPIKIAIITALFFITFLPFIPYWINNVSGLLSLFCLQCIIFFF